MGIKFNSIKFQILAAFTLLAVPLVLLAYSAFVNQQTFSEILRKTTAQEQVISLTSAIERDVVDLQRNVLIYKDTASDGSSKNVTYLYDRINRNISSLKDVSGYVNDMEALESIERHLQDYKVNFDVVLAYRNQREDLVRNFMQERENALVAKVVFSGLPETTVEKIKLAFLSAYNNALSYLATNDTSFLNQFKNDLAEGKRISLEAGSKHQDFSKTLANVVGKYEKKFLRIVTLTRNYVYLINVVMAGSAREILYNASILSETSRVQIQQEHNEIIEEQIQRRKLVFVLALFGLTLAVVVPAYFFRLITKPIGSITEVFKSLSAGHSVSKIPGQERSDEIGLLARAADVFKQKNEQTHSLLRLSEQSVAVQEQLNQDLLEEKRRAEAALSARTEFLANMSHELRTPLNSVIGYTVRLLKKPQDLNERQLIAVQTIERNGRHLLAMINDVLDFSKLEAEKLELDIQTVDVCQLCSEVVEQLRANSDEKGLTLEYMPSAEPLKVDTDPVRLTQVLINLLSNAIKYTEAGRVSLTLRPDMRAGTVRIDVRDTGVGIKEEDLGRLFKRFEQFDSDSRFKIGHGTGLGLAIVASLVPKLGGHITVESEFGRGSCFSLSMPLTHHSEGGV